MAARALMERDNMLRVTRLKELFNPALPAGNKLWVDLAQDFVNLDRKRLAGFRKANYAALTGQAKAKGPKKVSAALLARMGDIVQRRHDVVHNINSAGIVGPGVPLLDTTPEQWRHVLEVNVIGMVNTMRAFVPAMVDHGFGRVVNLASMAGKDGNPNLSIYSASKAAVIGLTKSAGKELATTGVLVNAIAPAVIATQMNADTDPDVLAHITSLIPMQRVGRPVEVAELIAFLASERVSFSTGAVYDISGGRATY